MNKIKLKESFSYGFSKNLTVCKRILWYKT